MLAGGLTAVDTAIASADLAKSKNCLACHAPDKKLIGPSYKDVALKYAKDANAAKTLAQKIQKGGVGVWGQVPMPANPQVSASEAETLAKWILATK
ncbi:MAG: cytochrome C' [Betaproteobacteria bacterium]|nr:c-type cytochrome [Pseudomonadota bacterium]NBO12589.1 cytochrome C' [Betaproteobacteria bacterium]NBO43714.1 cytochrome C' [Betaproteobacteria bacterium]NBP09673.1 cytochrome C' [Betaproteobacteria bacterium]NBP60974.1 cytochrome C' [Betaproteobacteria bacterium]